MIITIYLWLAYTWASLSAVIDRDWPFYLLALPVVALIAWFTLPGDDPQIVDEEDDTRFW